MFTSSGETIIHQPELQESCPLTYFLGEVSEASEVVLDCSMLPASSWSHRTASCTAPPRGGQMSWKNSCMLASWKASSRPTASPLAMQIAYWTDWSEMIIDRSIQKYVSCSYMNTMRKIMQHHEMFFKIALLTRSMTYEYQTSCTVESAGSVSLASLAFQVSQAQSLRPNIA